MRTPRTLSLLTENNPGALQRVISMIRRRGFTIETFAMGPAADKTMLRMTITVDVGAQNPEQARKQVAKLVDVIAVEDVTTADTVEHEFALVRVATGNAARHNEAARLAAAHDGRIVESQPGSVIVAMAGTRGAIENFVTAAEPLGVTETARTGPVALRSGADSRVHIMTAYAHHTTHDARIEGAA